MVLFSTLCFSQKKDTIPFKIDSSVVVLKDMNFPKYEDSNHIDYYNKRISDVLKKLYYVVGHEYQFAIERNWFIDQAKPALQNAINDREKFLKNKQ